MQIRQFDPIQDLDLVLDLWANAGAGIHLGRSDAPEEIRKKITHDPDLFLVAEAQGRLIGAVMGGFDGRRGMVYHLAVAAGERGKGAGRGLMAELEHRLQAKGCLKYYLLVARDSPEAVSFYRHLGWEVMDLFLMGKEIG